MNQYDDGSEEFGASGPSESRAAQIARAKADLARAAVENSRARARSLRHPVLTEVNDRVEYISDLMADGVYCPDTNRIIRKDLAEAWGVAVGTIYGYAAEAHRTRLDVVRERRAEVATLAVNALIEVVRGSTGMPGDRAAKVNASKTLLEFAGLDKPDEDKIQRHLVAGLGAEATPAAASRIMADLFKAEGPAKLPGGEGSES